MKRTHSFFRTVVMLVLLVASLGITTRSVAAQVEIPAGATISSATFSIYVTQASNETVRVHRITADWTETGVTYYNFGNSYDPVAIGDFVTDNIGWHSVDVTALVQGWVNGSYPNYGLLLEQGSTTGTVYKSSEDAKIDTRPNLEICYTTGGSGSICVTIQRPGTDPDGVVDAYIYSILPHYNGGTNYLLYTGLIAGHEKQSLIRFDFGVEPPSGGEGCTPGYWKQKQHFDSWVGYTTEQMYNEVFGVPYEKTLLSALKTGGGGEKALGRHATAALLNAASSGVDYYYTTAEIMAMVQEAYATGDFEGVKDLFEVQNEAGCPLN